MLASVNVGLPQPLATHKGDVRSGILKTPVAGRVRVRRLGLDGENLTVDGMLEGDVRIGDIYRIGSASPSRARRASHWRRTSASRIFPRPSSPAAAAASTCGHWRKATSAPATRWS
jgi:hypothetical protein